MVKNEYNSAPDNNYSYTRNFSGFDNLLKLKNTFCNPQLFFGGFRISRERGKHPATP